jgi:polar amino acid transport system substrate-binding protein
VKKGERGKRKMKKVFRLGIVSALMVSLLALSGCGGQQPTAPAGNAATGGAASEKVLKAGADIAYAPFEFMDDKQNPTGFDVDLLTEIGKDMGYTVKFETAAFDGLIAALGNGKFDVIASAMTITDERAKSVLFSDRYFESTQFIAVKKGSDIKSDADLKGKKVAVQQGTTGQMVVEGLGLNPKKFETVGDAINDMIIGGSDAVVADSPVILYFIKQNPDKNIEAVSGNFPKEYFGFAFKMDNKELADKVNATLKKFKENGKYNDIYKKWFNVAAPKF